jgi:long-chain fatty acid transport protein
MGLLHKHVQAIFLATIIAVPTSAFATNGYFLIGYGAKSRGMGGVGVAYAQDGLAAAANPAGMTDAGVGTMRIDFGLELFNPPRSVVHSSDTLGNPVSITDEESGSNEFLIPSFGAIYKFNRKLYMGMAVIGNGANTRYEQKVPGIPTCVNGDTSGGTGSYFFNFNCNADSTTVGVQLLQAQMLPSVAYVINKNHSVGASLAIGVQTFRAYGLGAFEDLGFAGAGADGTSGNGNDWSYGAGVRLGWLGKFMDKRLSIGTNYSSRVYMTKFDKYDELFAEQGDFDIPENYAIGLAYKITPTVTVAADIQQILFSDVASVGNTGPVNSVDLNTNGPCGVSAGNPTGSDAAVPGCTLGGDYGMGFGWGDATAYKIGLNWDYSTEWSFRTGYNHGDTTIKNDQVLFNMLAPATVEDHITVGASYRPSKAIEWTFNASRALENTICGPTAFGNLPGDDACITMEINTLGVSFAYNM